MICPPRGAGNGLEEILTYAVGDDLSEGIELHNHVSGAEALSEKGHCSGIRDTLQHTEINISLKNE